MLRICHSADWHLNAAATCAGTLVRTEAGENLRWVDQQRVVSSFVDGAIAWACDVAVIAGDIFDGPKPGPAEIVFAQRALGRLADEMDVVVIPGNHDMAVGGAPSPVETLSVGTRIHVLTRPQRITLACGEPEQPVQFAALPFPSKSSLLVREEYAGLSPEAVNAIVSEKLRAIVRGLRAQCDPRLAAVLVAHLPIVGAALNESVLAGQEHISPTAEDLEGWDYVALGDLHMAQQVSPRVFYSGSLDRLNFGEEHNEPAWTCVELDCPHAVPAEGQRFSLGLAQFPTPAREFITYSLSDLRTEIGEPGGVRDMGLDRLPIIRVQDRVSQEDYDAAQTLLAKWRQVPTFSEALEITRQTSARSEAMHGDLAPEAALVEWAKLNGREADLVTLMGMHREIAGAGR